MDAPLPFGPGSAGDAVRDLQQRLARAGHPCEPDDAGRFGPATALAVRSFQEKRGLRADGVCGAQTWSSLVEAGMLLGQRLLYLRSPMLRGDDVAELQRALGGLGFDAGKVDGILGPKTAAAVTEFQRNAGLPTDGICGPDTVAALRRVAGRVGPDGPGSTVASLREVEGLRRAPRSVGGLRVAVADGGDLAALGDALGRALADVGAVVDVVHHPDESSRASEANAFDAALFLGLQVRSEPGAACAYYARDDYESVGGRRLAVLATEALASAGLGGPVGAPRPMRVPALRETRMPAIAVELGPPTATVAHAPEIVAALAGAVARWVAAPVEVSSD